MARSERALHLLAVWNPFYAEDALGAHVEVLARHAQAVRDGTAREDDIYVYWGKVRSNRRPEPLPHLDRILALGEALSDDGDEARGELTLYLTDYQSLYVADVHRVVRDLPGDAEGHVPAYYASQGLTCDCWFRLADIRRIVTDDPRATQRELAQLRNARYHDAPVSLYGGMTELPLLVWRDDGRTWFDAEEREALADGLPWVLFDAGRTGVGALMEALRDDLFGAEAWERLDPTTRGFLATGEAILRQHRGDPAFDFAAVKIEYAKALEVEANRTMRRLMAGVKDPAIRFANIDGRSVDLATARLTLGAIARVIGSEQARYEHLQRTHRHGAWFTVAFVDLLERVAVVRNAGAHHETLRLADIQPLREELLGIGNAGAFVALTAG
jgi:hypothetical protein